MFELVYTMTDWYDGPRKGIADCGGVPHVFESEWRDGDDIDSDTFLLMPIDGETLSLAREAWSIWRRWETAFHLGETGKETHPALPGDRIRHVELKGLLKSRLSIEVARSLRKKALFRPREDSDWCGLGWRPLEVEWSDVE